MSIFKNLSNQEKKKVINQCKKVNYQATDHVATNIHWLIWDKDATDEYCKANKYPIISGIIKGCENWDLIENPYTKEDCLQAMKIAKLRRLDDRVNPIQIGGSVYNAEIVALGYSLMDAKKRIIFRERPVKIDEDGRKTASCLYITDGDLNFLAMPLREKPENAIKPEAISAADVETAKKYKLHLSKSHESDYMNFAEKNILVSRGEYFVTIPKSNKFLREVFDCESDKPEDYSDGDILLEIDESKTKHTEDLFHKKVAYAKAVQGYGRDGEFYHFYENGTGVCFKGE